MASNTLAQLLDVDPSTAWLLQNRGSVVLTLVAVVVINAVIMIFLMQSIARRSRSIKLNERIAKDAYDRELDLAIQEALARSINDELGPKGIVAFPTHAPRLVELDTSRVSPSTTVRYVKEFIVGHESSAIGLAGMRGSGKSTVMRALKTDAEFAPFVALIPSPVKYDSSEFIRRLLSEIAHAIVGTSTGWTIGTRRWISRVTMTRLIFFAIIGITGLMLGLSRVLDLTVNAVQIDLLLGLGLGLILIALAGGLYSFLNKIVEPGELGLPPDKKRARQVLQMLKWEVERGLSTKNAFKFWSLLESADEDSLKMKSRTLGHSDLVLELQALLKLFTNTNPEQRLVICIDELDKLDRSEHLVSIVNELKDLFHIQGVHFVVAVSTDALESFEKRGLPGRDAFDSAFDTIIYTNLLTLEESLAVINTRSTGFAPQIAMFCHAWSGGLARDLLRAARTAVELQRRHPDDPLEIYKIVSHIVLSDLRAAATASFRGLAADDPDTDALWQLLQFVEKQVEADEQSVPGRIAEVSALDFHTEALQVLHTKSMLGLYLLRAADALSRLDNYWDTTSNAMRQLETLLAKVAAAMPRVTGPKPMRDSAVSAATGKFDVQSLDTAIEGALLVG